VVESFIAQSSLAKLFGLAAVWTAWIKSAAQQWRCATMFGILDLMNHEDEELTPLS